ncbi:MAG: hypothetical protein CVU05_08250 [Bacteroidetes bacterium HGW-Bacteroidetes-21]|jgi:thioredoxin-related protein|nr:MAG: hypothetical protein CVU05_08250 [Bacteroidetes bacterium HGW-Bacteroidetes-21]
MKSLVNTIILCSFLLAVEGLFSQNEKDCRAILKKEIRLSSIQSNPDEFNEDFRTLVFCEFDSIDYQIFMGPKGDMLLVAQALMKYMSDKEKKKRYTYKNLQDELQEFKQNDEYQKIRKIVIAQNELFQRKASIYNWEYDKELMLKMGFKENQIKDINAIVKQNQLLSYQEILKIYSDTINVRNEVAKIEQEKQKKKLMDENQGMKEWFSGLPAYMEYDLGLKEASKINKPILIYFTGYGCVNARQMESTILNDPEVLDYINSNFVFIVLFVDERTKLEESEIYFSESLNRNMKYAGDKNLEIEIRDFKMDSQPLFIHLDNQKKEIARIGYTRKQSDFISFLKGDKK